MLYRLSSENPTLFPDPSIASKEGLLAYGGDLQPQRLLAAYTQGIFPWYDETSPILWWSPDPRCIILREKFRIPKTVRRERKKSFFTVTMNTAFEQVISNCATSSRNQQNGTWIVQEMQQAYILLYKLGYAHSIEVWDKHVLIGGLYGVSIGKAFFGESMFHNKTNASKIALLWLAEYLWSLDFHFIDCQVLTTHILRYGAMLIPRKEFLQRLTNALSTATIQDSKVISLQHITEEYT